MKKCSLCKWHLPESDFHVNRANKDGRQSRCKKCTRDSYYTPNKESRLAASRERRKAGGQARDNEWQRNNRRNRPLVRMVQEARVRAAKKGISFDLSCDDLSIPNTCPVLGIPVGMSYGARSDNSPSIDRIDCEKGYVRGNVVIVSWRANRLKSDATLAEMEALVRFYRSALGVAVTAAAQLGG